MKKLYLTLLLLLCYVFVYSSQGKYDNFPIVNSSKLDGLGYSIIAEDDGATVVKLASGEIIIVIDDN